jgi:hypothetical protein
VARSSIARPTDLNTVVSETGNGLHPGEDLADLGVDRRAGEDDVA